jgi:outer membrane lipoprotein-sorting protein
MIDSRSGDITTFTMGNMEINPKIADSEFKIKFAPGTKIVNK